MKKKIVALLYVLILFSTFSIGFATWILSRDFIFEPDYIYDTEFNFYNQNITYNGQSQDITIPDSLTDVINLTNYEEPKYYENGTTTIDDIHKDSGTYDVLFKSINSNYEDVKVKFTIEPMIAQFDYGILIGSKTGKRFTSETSNISYQTSAGTLIYPDIKIKNAIGNDEVNADIGSNNLELKVTSTEQKVNYNVSKLTGKDAFNYKLPNETTFTITLSSKKMKIHLDITEYSLPCPSTASQRQWGTYTTDGIQKLLETYIGNHIIDENGDNPALAVCIDYIDDGTYYYLGDSGKKPTDTSLIKGPYNAVIGSTYEVKLKIKQPDKYEFVPGLDTFILKYQTVKIGETYYTIEDAIAKTGNIKLIGDATKNNTFIPTTFTKLNYYKDKNTGKFTKEFSLTGDRQILIPYDNNDSYVNNSDTMNDATGPGQYDYVYSALIVPEGITLNISNGARLVVAGYVRHTGLVRNHGVLMNNGIINVDGGSFYSYGYTKGEYDNSTHDFKGVININNNSTASDVLKMYDWPGGTNATHMYNILGGKRGPKVFPVYSYSFHNISSKIVIDNTSSLQAHYRISAGGQNVYGDVNLIGKNSNGVGLFTLIGKGNITKYAYNNNVSNGVALEDYSINNSITSSNQSAYHKDVIEVSGDFEDNPMQLSAAGFTFQTSATLALPIGFMKIKLNNGTKGTLAKSSFKFMPGSEVIIDKGASLTIGSGIDVIGYDENYKTKDDYMYDGKARGEGGFTYSYVHNNWFTQTNKENIGARIINNGTLITNGGCGMKILNTEPGAQTIFTTKNSGTVNDLETLSSGKLDSAGFKSVTKDSNGKIVNKNGVVGKFNTKTVYVANDKNEWVDQNATLNEVKITFVKNNGEQDEPISFFYTSNENGYMVSGNEITPEKLYNEFSGWFTDPKLTNSAVGQVISTESTNKTLYAAYKPRNYSVIYDYGYNNEPLYTDDGVVSPKENITFEFDGSQFTLADNTKSTVLNLPADSEVSYDGKRQNKGWFVGNHLKHLNIGTSTVTAEQMALYLKEDDALDLFIYKQFFDFSIIVNNNSVLDNEIYYLATGQTLKEVGYVDRSSEFNKNLNDINYKYYYQTYSIANTETKIMFSDLLDYKFDTVDQDITLNLDVWNKYKITTNLHGLVDPLNGQPIYLVPDQVIGADIATQINDVINATYDDVTKSIYSKGILFNNKKATLNDKSTFTENTVISFDKVNKNLIKTNFGSLTGNTHAALDNGIYLRADQPIGDSYSNEVNNAFNAIRDDVSLSIYGDKLINLSTKAALNITPSTIFSDSTTISFNSLNKTKITFEFRAKLNPGWGDTKNFNSTLTIGKDKMTTKKILGGIANLEFQYYEVYLNSNWQAKNDGYMYYVPGTTINIQCTYNAGKNNDYYSHIQDTNNKDLRSGSTPYSYTVTNNPITFRIRAGSGDQNV